MPHITHLRVTGAMLTAEKIKILAHLPVSTTNDCAMEGRENVFSDRPYGINSNLMKSRCQGLA